MHCILGGRIQDFRAMNLNFKNGWVAMRKDGQKKKARLLEAATKVFAKKGFRDTTVSDICKTAGANVASVNYYFQSKEGLYAEVWRNAFNLALETYPPDGGLGEDSSFEERLGAMIKSMVYRMLDRGKLGCAGQILLMEISNPTEAIHLVKKDAILPLRKRFESLISEYLGKKASKKQIVFCVMSIINQCLMFGLKNGQLPPVLRSIGKEELCDSLANHITMFSLAGIEAVKQEINKK